MSKVVLFAAVNPIETGESLARWHPLSVLALASSLAAEGHQPVIIDCQIDPDWKDSLVAELRDAAMLGVTCMTGPSIRNALTAISIGRKVRAELPVMWGGYHATLAYRGILREELADVVSIGPGDRTVTRLAAAVERAGGVPAKEHLAEIPNLAFLNGRREISKTGKSVPGVTVTNYEIVDMNDLPEMNYGLIRVEDYYNDRRQDVSYISSYGCPYACTYCAEPTNSLRNWRALNPDRVAREVLALHQRYRPNTISLLDPNFSSNVKRVKDIVANLESEGVPEGFDLLVNMRARDVVRLARVMDIGRLRAAGFRRIFIGAESGSDRMLKAMKKGSNRRDNIDACISLNEAGIQSLTSWMHDLPGETIEDSEETLSLLEELSRIPTNRQMHHFYTPFPSTEMYEAFFGTDYDEERSQEDWANSDTYSGSSLWGGRPEFRERVLSRLASIREASPTTFERKDLPIS